MSVSDFNVKNGILGLGSDIMIEIIGNMTSIRDVQNVFLFLSPIVLI